MRTTALCLVLLLAMPIKAASGVSTSSNIADLSVARELVDIMNIKEELLSHLKNLEPYMKKQYPRITDVMWKRYYELLASDELLNRATKLYARHFTSDELNEIITFYKTPAGQKFLKKSSPFKAELSDFITSWPKECMAQLAKELNIQYK